jgi:single-strand DNA-binding protein
MSQGLNRITIIGNLGRNPEMRYTQTGKSVCNMSIGVTEKRRNGEDFLDHTEWFTIVCFGKIADNVVRFLKKGRQVYVDGKIQNKKWKDKNGIQRTSYEIIVNQILFLGFSQKDDNKQKESSSSKEDAKRIDINDERFIKNDSYDSNLIKDKDVPF